MKCRDTIIIFFIAGIFGCILAQDNLPSKDEVLQKIPDLANVPGINEIKSSEVKNVEKLIKQKCEKNGGQTAYQNAAQAATNANECLKSLVNIEKVQEEIRVNTPNGSLDVVFKNYCRKSPMFKSCMMNFTDALEPCLEEKELETKNLVVNVSESLLNFICHKEGDRIALFIASNGPECFEKKSQGIQTCINNTLSSYIPAATNQTGGMHMLQNLPLLILDKKKCSDIAEMQDCIVNELEGCKDPTTANIVDSLLNFVKQGTPCENVMNAGHSTLRKNNTGKNLVITVVPSFLITIVAGLTIRYV